MCQQISGVSVDKRRFRGVLSLHSGSIVWNGIVICIYILYLYVCVFLYLYYYKLDIIVNKVDYVRLAGRYVWSVILICVCV